MSWTVGLARSAVRDLDRIPPRVVPAVIEFIYGPLAQNPRRLGKPLRDDLEGEWSARRGDYRVLYQLDADAAQMIVTRIGHGADLYRPR